MAEILGENKNWWGLARAKFFGEPRRAFFSVVKQVVENKSKYSRLPHDEVAIDVPLQDFTSDVDRSRLTNLVKDKEKRLDELLQLGGVEGIATFLKTDVNNGINGENEDVSERKDAFGTNTYSKPPTKSFFHFVWEACKDPSNIILLVCAAVTTGIDIWRSGEVLWYDGVSLSVALILSIFVTSMSNYWQNRQFEKLSNVSFNIQVDVVRNGRRQQIKISEIVVGDVVCLKTGDEVPADGLFWEGHSLQVYKSSTSNDSEHFEVNHNQNPFLLYRSKVVDGYGKMLVTSVGKNTSWGEMISMISRDSRKQTPLQVELKKLSSSIGKVGSAAAFVVFVVLLVKYFTGNTKDDNGEKKFNGSKTKASDVIFDVVGIISNAVTIADVAIPEGLSLAVTLTLAYSLKRMRAVQSIIRKKSACETMGLVTAMCIDKTGTLTLNQMKVTETQIGLDPMEGKRSTYREVLANVRELLHPGIGLNTTGSEFLGSPTEKAILQWAELELKMDMEVVKKNWTILHMEAFNSEKKRSGVLVKKIVDNSIQAHWKGAAEMILTMCSHYYDSVWNLKALDHHAREKFDQIIQDMAARGLRCIAFARKQLEAESDNGTTHQKVPDNCLTLLGLVGLKDPCRPDVNKALKDCKKAGVNIKMITGDNVFTATAIAKECGILDDDDDQEREGGVVVEGIQFRDYTEEERLRRVDKIRVMARSSAFDKLLMVQCLQKNGHIVAMIGDGTNDAPALEEANIGLSIGTQCNEVAKESSDIVILNDNFASIATVLRWGRCVYTNVQKFLQFQLTVNIASVVINFVAAIKFGEVPFSTVQLMWVSLIMDTIGPLALASEKPTKKQMEKPPVGQTEPLITNVMLRNLLAQAIYQIILLLTLQFKGASSVSTWVNDTVIFNTFALCQVFNEFNARKFEKKNVFEGIIHKNKLFVALILVSVIIQVVMVQVEVLNTFADTEKLNWGQWRACIGLAAVSWLIGWPVKFMPVPQKQISSYFTWISSIHAPDKPIFRYLAWIWRLAKKVLEYIPPWF